MPAPLDPTSARPTGSTTSPAFARTPSADGLEGVVVAHTALSDVDGERGRLVIAGHDVEPLALSARYEDALGLLLDACKAG
jgi:citrate synthase